MKKIKKFESFISENPETKEELRKRMNELENNCTQYYLELAKIWINYNDYDCELTKYDVITYLNDNDFDFGFCFTCDLIDDIKHIIVKNKIKDKKILDKTKIYLEILEDIDSEIDALADKYFIFFPEIDFN